MRESRIPFEIVRFVLHDESVAFLPGQGRDAGQELQSDDAVLLTRMLQFRENINGHLKVMGMVANRTFGAELTSDETNRLSELEVKAKNAWGENVPRFETSIRQSTEVREAEDDHRPLGVDDRMAGVFDLLAKEVQSRLPTFCRPTGVSVSARAEVMK